MCTCGSINSFALFDQWKKKDILSFSTFKRLECNHVRTLACEYPVSRYTHSARNFFVSHFSSTSGLGWNGKKRSRNEVGKEKGENALTPGSRVIVLYAKLCEPLFHSREYLWIYGPVPQLCSTAGTRRRPSRRVALSSWFLSASGTRAS